MSEVSTEYSFPGKGLSSVLLAHGSLSASQGPALGLGEALPVILDGPVLWDLSPNFPFHL